MTGNILGAVESEEEASETDTHSEDEKMEGIRKEETTLSCQSRCTGEGPGSFDSGHYTAHQYVGSQKDRRRIVLLSSSLQSSRSRDGRGDK